MNEESVGPGEPSAPLRDDRMIFLLPADKSDRLGLGIDEIWEIVWRQKLVIIAMTLLFTAASVAYALLADQWFKADVVLVPAKAGKGIQGQLGGLAGLANLAGVNLNDKGDSVEALAVLRSNEFIRSFIDEQHLLPILFADEWDGAARRWRSSNPKDWPDDRDAVRFFQHSICEVISDDRSGLVTVSIEWTDRNAAAAWANLLVDRLNEKMRQRVLTESDRNVKFLRQELAVADVATLQQSISRLLENELQTLMLARGNEEFAFRIVDRATVPKWRSKPKRVLVVCAATLGGGIVTVIGVVLVQVLRRDRRDGGAAPLAA